MNPRPLPRAATWLLERLGHDSRFEPLIGDLVEQFEAGRSRGWYWRQTIGALANPVRQGLRTHAASFIVAVLAGCALTWLWQLGCSLAFQSVYVNLADIKKHPWTSAALLRLLGIQANMASEYALYFSSAWLVTRVHRAHRRAALVVFAAALVARNLPSMAQPFEGSPDTRIVVSVATHVILTALTVACTLVGGLWVIRTKRIAEMGYRSRLVAILWIAQNLVTGLLFAACRVGEVSYRGSMGYLSLYAAEAGCGLYLAILLWREHSVRPAAGRLARVASRSDRT